MLKNIKEHMNQKNLSTNHDTRQSI